MSNHHDERGVIAIFMSVIIGILLLTTTTFAARVSVNELNQSSTVDRSESAYYAAEAGIEEAIRRLDNNPNGTTCQIFPEEFYTGAPASYPTSAICPASQPGDQMVLTDNSGNGFSQTRPSIDDSSVSSDLGQTGWRHRKVYSQTTYYAGNQAKDETIQFDASELRRLCAGGGEAGAGPGYHDCGGPATSIYQNFRGMQYCWDDGGNPNVKLEVTDVSFNANYTGFVTEKTIIDHSTYPARAQVNFTSGGSNCTNINVNSSARRYIFRIKPLFVGAAYNGPTDVQQFRFAVTYHATLLESPQQPAGQRLYIPNDTFLIDVVGQSGDVQRRLVARKQRSGRLIGIFDYVLYSGDQSKSLCKTGVESEGTSYDPDTCSVLTNIAAPSAATLNYNQRQDISVYQSPSVTATPLDGPHPDAAAQNGTTLQMYSSADTFQYDYTYQGPSSPSKFFVDARQDIDQGNPGPAQIQVVINAPGGTLTQVVNASTTAYQQYGFNINSLNLNPGDAVTITIQFINDSCTGCASPYPPNSDRNAFVDYFGVTNNSSL